MMRLRISHTLPVSATVFTVNDVTNNMDDGNIDGKVDGS